MPNNYDLPDDLIQQYVSEVRSDKGEKVEIASTDPEWNKENEAEGNTPKSSRKAAGSFRSLWRLMDHNGQGSRDHGIAEPDFAKRSRRKSRDSRP